MLFIIYIVCSCGTRFCIFHAIGCIRDTLLCIFYIVFCMFYALVCGINTRFCIFDTLVCVSLCSSYTILHNYTLLCIVSLPCKCYTMFRICLSSCTMVHQYAMYLTHYSEDLIHDSVHRTHYSVFYVFVCIIFHTILQR